MHDLDVIERDVVEIHPAGERLPLVRLWVSDVGDGYVRRLSVVVAADGLDCETVIVDDADDELARFFEALESDWRGWSGVRKWEALDERSLRIEATHHGDHVTLLFIVRRGYNPETWEAQVRVQLPAGEPLRQIAAQARRLLGG